MYGLLDKPNGYANAVLDMFGYVFLNFINKIYVEDGA
jgi:hypothetical protein